MIVLYVVHKRLDYSVRKIKARAFDWPSVPQYGQAISFDEEHGCILATNRVYFMHDGNVQIEFEFTSNPQENVPLQSRLPTWTDQEFDEAFGDWANSYEEALGEKYGC